MAIARCIGDDQGGDVLGRLVAVMRRVRQTHLRDAGHCGSLFGHAFAASASDKHLDVGTELASRGDGVERRAPERRIIVFGNDEDSHP